MAQVHHFNSQSQRSVRHDPLFPARVACMTPAAREDDTEASANRRGYGDAYELGAVGFARRGWSA